jgi:molecular chaperone DnaK (HSP70)
VRLGIDYGTTNTVVVGADRGRYPVVPHVTETAAGRVVREVYPSLIVYDRDTALPRFGADAERCLLDPADGARYVPIRSLKRLLHGYADGARVAAETIPGGLDVKDLLTGFASSVCASVRASGLFPPGQPLEAVLTWPANANGAQRHVTRAAFRDAGFTILRALNEPSAAAIELADRLVHGDRARARKLRATVGIFDLGGGTFDASVVSVAGSDYTVLASAGLEALGGDDFDELLARLFAEKLRLDFDTLPPFQRTQLLLHACREKERFSTGAVRNLTLDPEELGWPGAPCKVTATAFGKRLAERLEPAVDTLAAVVGSARARDAGVAPESLSAIYLVGGSSRLPQVGTLLARRFPKVRLVTTDKPFTATAMGAAIHSAESLRVHEVFARHFGVIRLADHGQREIFAPVFQAGLRLPDPGQPPVTARVAYAPRHNIGHLRYLECAGLDAEGRPGAGARHWSDILFPYDPAVPIEAELSPGAIAARDDLAGAEAEETYACDSDGIITVRITRGADGRSRTYEVYAR